MVFKLKRIRYVLSFTSFMFVQFVILRLSNQAGRGYLPEAQQERVYLFIQVAAIIGFLGHALFRSFKSTRRLYKPVSVAAIALCLCGALVLLFGSPASKTYLFISGADVLLLGFVGGAVYERLASAETDRKHLGLCIGIGYAVAVLLQFCLQLQWTVVPAIAVFLPLCFAFLAGFLLRDAALQTPVDEGGAPAFSKSAPLFSVVITFALLLFTSYYNSYIHHLQIASGYTDYNVYSWPRLLMIPTVIVLGYVGDIRGGQFLPVCTLCVAATALLNTALLGRDTYLLNMCLYYVALTAVIAYYHVTFLHVAQTAKHPALWACMGRVIDSVSVLITLGLNLSEQSQAVVLVINITALAVVIIMMALSGALDLSASKKPAPEAAVNETAEVDPFPIVQENYGITPSELKILRELVLTDDKQEVIASRLDISVSTLRHHVTSLYRKTGAQTRLALSNLVNNVK